MSSAHYPSRQELPLPLTFAQKDLLSPSQQGYHESGRNAQQAQKTTPHSTHSIPLKIAIPAGMSTARTPFRSIHR